MARESALDRSLRQALEDRAESGMTIIDLYKRPFPFAPDLFSNDYLSLGKDPILRKNFLNRLETSPNLFGSTGSRYANGDSAGHQALERRLEDHYRAGCTLLFNSGFNANLGFFGSVPQPEDVLLIDELIHASTREGIRLSAARDNMYRFPHNSIDGFRETLNKVLKNHSKIGAGEATVFVAVESLYSVDGDFAPLKEIVEIVEELVPADSAHIIVDEAHTTGICGPHGEGYVSLLGLNNRVHTTLHTFGKAVNMMGGVIITTPAVRLHLTNFANNIIFSTALPHALIHAINAIFDVIASPRGDEARRNLVENCKYGHAALSAALKDIPDDILAVDDSPNAHVGELYSPIIPVFVTKAQELAAFLIERGYAPTPLTFPVVRRPRIRTLMHGGNTKDEIDGFIACLREWALAQLATTTDMLTPRARL
ncbi:8-amino-7-oxononanoate synthase [Coniophora puteana RWD-64-598 SS2]|uniref:8-amino-7-oxononanoate synthase n=1 Tax=Coniophora puteana (strain RWD-64-598) TaxID=741705 RepID=A0A5M3MG41_CONPW|nr:8-amino-7-oxononanoate synthase [Coniophora puteana RWD-64-598 SS2]EIW78133.1 8-amino-7-oxononanoate synthase [Coniophora puteana RWD-64-598 SS2]